MYVASPEFYGATLIKKQASSLVHCGFPISRQTYNGYIIATPNVTIRHSLFEISQVSTACSFTDHTDHIILPRAHAQRGKVIGSVVVVIVVVSTKIARSRLLSEILSANCSQGVRNRKKACVHVSRLSKRDHKSFLLVTPISHTHSYYLHMHTPHSRSMHTRMRMLVIR